MLCYIILVLKRNKDKHQNSQSINFINQSFKTNQTTPEKDGKTQPSFFVPEAETGARPGETGRENCNRIVTDPKKSLHIILFVWYYIYSRYRHISIEASMEKKIPKNEVFLAYGLSLCFLVIHIAMLCIFKQYGVTPMVHFNYFSIAFYILSFFLLKQGKLWLYCVTVYLEVVAHMSMAVCMVGPYGGFHATIIGLSILLFYTEYLGKAYDQPVVPSLILNMIGMLSYIGCLAYSHFIGSPYSLPAGVNFWLQVLWGLAIFLIASFFMEILVTIAIRAQKSLADLARHDPLTGLFNRAGYEQMLNAADLTGIGLLLIDIDCFKEVNDTYGHVTGDEILKKTAEALRSSFRSDDYICRIGGDEFAVILNTDPLFSNDLIGIRVGKINHTLADTADGLPKASISAGYAPGAGSEDIDDLFKHADKALYVTKEHGRNGVTLYSE